MDSKNAVSSRASVLKQPEGGKVTDELRQLTDLTQVQLAETLGAAYATINRWKNRLIQPSPLVFKQLRVLIDKLSDSSSKALQGGNQQLLAQYFSQEE